MGVSAVVVVGSVVAGAIQADSASQAAKKQQSAAEEAMKTHTTAQEQQLATQQPYITAGQSALQQLVTGTQPGGQFSKQFEMPNKSPTATPYKAEEAQAQQFATKEALAKMQDQMAVGGQGLSSNAIAGAGKLAANIGSQYEQQGYNQWLQSNELAFNQALQGNNQALGTWQANQQAQMAPLEYLSNLGANASANSSNIIGGQASSVSNLQQGIGNAQAAGTIGEGNAYAGMVNNITSGVAGGMGTGGTTGTTGTTNQIPLTSSNLGGSASLSGTPYTTQGGATYTYPSLTNQAINTGLG